MARIVVGGLLLFIGIGGLLDVWLNPTAFKGPLPGQVAAFAIVFVLPGLAFVYFGRRARSRRAQPGPSTTGGGVPAAGAAPATVREAAAPAPRALLDRSESPDTMYALVLVAGVPLADYPIGQHESELVKKIAAAPPYPLLPDATITTLRGMTLPTFTRSAVEPFVWSLQARFNRRGGAWQAEYFEFPLARFLVLYLE